MMSDAGDEIRKSREALGLSQAKLSEISGIPQYLLSAFELGKGVLSDADTTRLARAFEDRDKIAATTQRRKRYQPHIYEYRPHDPLRVELHATTKGNSNYLAELAAMYSSAPCTNLTAMSLFSGCGGLSLGFSKAGFQIKGFLEIEDALSSIYQLNFPGVGRLGADITAISDEIIRREHSRIGDVDAIIGGPPCQGFSLSGKRNVNDPRNNLFTDYLRFIRVFRPKVAVIENVRLLTSMKMADGTFVKHQIEQSFASEGYSVAMYEVNARDYGVPQHRERVFFVAVRKDLNAAPSFPSPTHGISSDMFTRKAPWRTFADACSDLTYLEAGEKSQDPLHFAVAHPNHVIDWLWDVREGYSAHENTDPAKRPPSGYNTTYKRQIWLQPGATVQTTFGMISGCRNVHPIATRSLTIREAARLQSFPDEYQFDGSLGVIRTGIGNAVPPLLAYALGNHVRTTLLDLIKVPCL
jgi:DNA (cytosine-5)-methyltransferase 1